MATRQERNWGGQGQTLLQMVHPVRFSSSLRIIPNPKPYPTNLTQIRMTGTVHSNKMKHMNGEIRDTERVTRNLKCADTPILKSEQIYHN